MTDKSDDIDQSIIEDLIQLLDSLKKRQQEAGEKYRTAQSPIAEQEQGRFHGLSYAGRGVQEILEKTAPTCCTVRTNLQRDGRYAAPFVWTCRHCGEKISVTEWSQDTDTDEEIRTDGGSVVDRKGLLYALDRLAIGMESADPHIRHEAKRVAAQNISQIAHECKLQLDTENDLVTDGGTDMDGIDRIIDDTSSAVISNDGRYRYRLARMWDAEKPTLAWVMLNPSTADETEDDPTVRRCIGYAKDWGYGSIAVGNLFALRATDPSELDDDPNPIGEKNDFHLRKIANEAAKVVVAWGASYSGNGLGEVRRTYVTTLLEEETGEVFALDTTKDGHPVHPLYQPSDADPAVYTTNTDHRRLPREGDASQQSQDSEIDE